MRTIELCLWVEPAQNGGNLRILAPLIDPAWVILSYAA
jgi:hypothetical protein